MSGSFGSFARAAAALTLVVAAGSLAGCGGKASTSDTKPTANSSLADSTAHAELVAMGDSYSSGPGIPTVEAPPCDRSNHNFSHLVATKLAATSFDDATCAGATTRSITQGTLFGAPPQIRAVSSKAKVVIIGIGGNDAHLFQVLTGECEALRSSDPKGAPCEAQTKSMVETGIATAQANLLKIIATVKRRARSARILLVGYPQVIPAKGTCSQLPIAKGDYAYGRSMLEQLNTAISTDATQTNVTYINVWKPSAGHNLCAKVPWINGPQGGNGAAAYHPFEAEQSEVASLIEKALGNKI
jgi:lysophospholipase L1-like esterase